MATHIDETIEHIVRLHARAERAGTPHQRGIERVTAALGRPAVLYAVVATALLWVVAGTLLGGRAPDPPPFSLLALGVSFGALVIALMVLIAQNRQLSLAEKRARLDLEISLLAERKVTKVIELLEELRRDLPNVPNRHDPEAEEMQTGTDPHAVAEALDASIEEEVRASLDGEPPRD